MRPSNLDCTEPECGCVRSWYRWTWLRRNKSEVNYHERFRNQARSTRGWGTRPGPICCAAGLARPGGRGLEKVCLGIAGKPSLANRAAEARRRTVAGFQSRIAVYDG